MDFLKDIVKEIGGEYTQLASDIDETEKYVDTGSYIFNALVSGSIFGGVSGNKITAIAGESSTGKTFFSLAVVKNFLDSNPDGYCLYFDTEAAITKSLVESRGIDTSRLVVVNVVTIEEFRSKALKAVDLYLKKPEGERKPCMFVIGAYVPTKEMGGGSGLKYAASTIIYLSKKKEKDGTEVVGNIIKAKTAKSRLSKENKDVEIRLYYDERGLDRYYGLLELGEIGGLWKNVAGRYEIDGKKIYAKQILKEPEVYFTEEVMQQLDEIARKEFSYGEG